MNKYLYDLEHLLEREHQTNLNLLRLIEIYEERIIKGIEYIEFQKNNPQYDNVWRKYECESLIEILKGED